MESKSIELKKRKRKSSGESAAKVSKTETTQTITTTTTTITEEVKEMHKFILVKLNEAKDAQKAAEMAKYMKTTQFFFGVQAPKRKEIFKEAKAKYPITSFSDWHALVWNLWTGKSREEMYMALLACEGYKAFLNDKAVPLFTQMVRTATHWDTLDAVASMLSRVIVASPHRQQHEAMLKHWVTDSNMWVRRAALLAHLHHKEQTNVELLEHTVTALMKEEEFFIRKAIGWVLRQYSKSNAAWVKLFVQKHDSSLSALSKKEALKHIPNGLKLQPRNVV